MERPVGTAFLQLGNCASQCPAESFAGFPRVHVLHALDRHLLDRHSIASANLTELGVLEKFVHQSHSGANGVIIPLSLLTYRVRNPSPGPCRPYL